KLPILIGASRKSFIGITLGNVPPEERLEGTLAVTAYCTMKGVDIIRVHDVLPNKRVIRMMEAILWQRL
ncbi:MAG TPA: dihydropteroate synthase, partial [Thermotoga sp.]|nr:dihydropteroate synthase [Thermotoga sp.]